MEKITMIPQALPVDLQFVLEKDIPLISGEFIKKYTQVIPETKLQEILHALYENPELLTKEQTLEFYSINTETLVSVFNSLKEKAQMIGVSVTYVDMTKFSEDEIHNNYADDPNHIKHAETARSDGKNLFLEQDLQAAGGMTGRTYDLLHLAFGHMIQWSTESKQLLLEREQAWSIGYRNHDKSPKIVVDMMSLYEFEAGMQGVEALHQILDVASISEEQKESILQYFIDYAYADRDYIIQHYRGNHESFQKFWKFGQPIPPRQALPEVKEFIERDPVEIGLIRDMQK